MAITKSGGYWASHMEPAAKRVQMAPENGPDSSEDEDSIYDPLGDSEDEESIFDPWDDSEKVASVMDADTDSEEDESVMDADDETVMDEMTLPLLKHNSSSGEKDTDEEDM